MMTMNLRSKTDRKKTRRFTKLKVSSPPVQYLVVSGEIAELKAGFKHEMHFNSLNENCQTEMLTWGVDSNVQARF